MKVHLYKVREHENSMPLDQLLRQIRRNPLEDRLRLVGAQSVRIEDLVQKDGLWFIDFLRLRYDHGPGRAHAERGVEGFEFEDGEGFGEETAALFDPANGFMAIQYNHFGVRSGTIQTYLSEYHQNHVNAYELMVKFDPEAERRLARQNLFTRLDFSIDVGRMSAADRAAGRSVSQALSFGRTFGAEKISISLSMGPGKKKGKALNDRVIGDAIAWIKERVHEKDDYLVSAEVAAKENPDSATEIIDLVAHRLTTVIGDLKLGRDLRYPVVARWDGLARAYNGWRNIVGRA